METDQLPRELPIVGGHLALDFANTVDDPLGPARHDHVATYDGLVRWSLRVGTLGKPQARSLLEEASRRPRSATATVRKAHELRDALNDVFGSALEGSADLAEPWERLRPFAAVARSESELWRGGDGARWTWTRTDDLAVVLHPVASAAADLLVSADLRRLKRCARCPWLFLDLSKNHSRRWCDMNDCGRAAKIELYVARRSARRGRPARG